MLHRVLAHIIAIAAGAILFSGCMAGGKQVQPEPTISASSPTPSQHPATGALWQSGPPLGWEGSLPQEARTSKATLRSWIASIKSNGTNTLFLQRYLFEHRSEQVRWKDVVAEAHRQKVRVYAVLNLREKLVGDSRSWNDTRLNVQSATLEPSQFPDLLHPEFRAFIQRASLDLATAGVDLIVFRFDPPAGPFDGFSRSGLNGFRRDFQYRLSPQNLFTSGNQQTSPEVIAVSQVRRGFAPGFWRWAGWKNRKYLDILDGVMLEVRQQEPGVRFGIELHVDTMENPRQALVQYTEDFLESRQRDFDLFIVAVPARGVHDVAESSVGQAAMEMTELLDNPSMVFVLVSGRRALWSTANEALNVKTSLGLQQGVGLGFRRQ